MILFEPAFVGQLTVRNRLMRSATAERVADPVTGAPGARQAEMYRKLAEGGTGLIVTGHAYIERPGKAHPEMASIADDSLIPLWREVIRPAQDAGARVMMQINHCGASCDPLVTGEPLSPSGVPTNRLHQPHAASEEEIERVIAAFAQAARRAREAGLDGVQLHGAHGYLINQFMMPSTNLRNDAWGGDPGRRQTFLRRVVAAIRRQVGDDYPLWIKLGVASDAEHGLTLTEGAAVAVACAGWGSRCDRDQQCAGRAGGARSEERWGLRAFGTCGAPGRGAKLRPGRGERLSLPLGCGAGPGEWDGPDDQPVPPTDRGAGPGQPVARRALDDGGLRALWTVLARRTRARRGLP